MSNLSPLNKIKPDKRAISAVTLLTSIGWVLGALVVLFVILPIGGRFFGLTIGGTAEAATSIDGGFARLVRQIESLPTGGSAEEALTVDKGFWLVSFNKAPDVTTEKATSPPDCNGITCMCVCIDDKCQKIDVDRNRGRDCRPFYDYDRIEVSGKIDDNDDGKLYVKGFKTISFTLKRDGTVLKLIGK